MINLGKLITDELHAERERNKALHGGHENDNVFSAYYAGYCERQIWLAKKGLKEFPDDVLGKMKVGSILHEWVQRTFAAHFRSELPFSFEDGEIEVRGRIDALDERGDIYDFKSERSVSYLPRDEKTKEHIARDFHEAQMQLYTHARFLDPKKPVSGPQTYLLYIDKNDLSVVQIQVKYDGTKVSAILEKYKRVYEGLGAKECPFEPCGCWFCEQEKLEAERKKAREVYEKAKEEGVI
jgi:hypothetical protein